MKKKIAIFENEYTSVKGAFDTANLIKFDNSLELIIFPSSQVADLNKISEYAAIFIDIDLSSKSELDGFGLIEKIVKIKKEIVKKIIILTGNNKIKEILIKRNLYSPPIEIIIKPTDYREISKYLRKVFDKTKG